MSHAPQILIQLLGVSQRRDSRGREALIYAPSPLVGGDGPPPEEACREINGEVLARLIDEVRRRVDELAALGRTGQPRGTLGIEDVSAALTEYILPAEGLCQIVQPDVHPQFDIVKDAAQEIPWEVLQEFYGHCDCGAPPRRIGALAPGTPGYCPRCGSQLNVAGGRLAIERHLSHLVRGGTAPASQGHEFLIAVDPCDDLLTPDKDPAGICRAHIRQITEVVRQRGYTVRLLRQQNVTVHRLREAISSPSVVGMYYFGHGEFRPGDAEGKLLLADGGFHATQIQQLNPQLRFVFLNACEGAATGSGWTLEKKAISVGQAFARGGPSKCVVATLWPVVNVQAAEFARDFFQQLATAEVPLGEALRTARLASLARYEAGAADISWMAYRFFGDPNRQLPQVTSPSSPAEPGVAGPRTAPLFQEGRLDADRFAFNIRDVLLRAAKRRNLQNRQRISPADFLAGLVRTGPLTRQALRITGVEPDSLYMSIVQTREPSSEETPRAPSGNDPEADRPVEDEPTPPDREQQVARLRQLLDRWIVRDQQQFSARLLRLLDGAATTAATRGEASTVSEWEVLAQFTAAPDWALGIPVPLPAATRFAAALQTARQSADVDENGRLRLGDLTPEARRVVDDAHELAQQRGLSEVPNRLLLAALLGTPDSYAARVCRRVGCDAGLLSQSLIATTSGKSPVSFELSLETAGRALLPVLRRARELASPQGPVGERELFQAFCLATPEPLKQSLIKLPPPLAVDLSTLARSVDAGESDAGESDAGAVSGTAGTAEDETQVPSGGAARPESPLPAPLVGQDLLQHPLASQLLQAAVEAAAAQGRREVTSIHLLVGLLIAGRGLLSDLLRRRGLRPEQLVVKLLLVVAPAGAAPRQREIAISQNVQQILTLAAARMQSAHRQELTEADLCHAVFDQPVGSIRSVLKQLQLDWLIGQPFDQLP